MLDLLLQLRKAVGLQPPDEAKRCDFAAVSPLHLEGHLVNPPLNANQLVAVFASRAQTLLFSSITHCKDSAAPGLLHSSQLRQTAEATFQLLPNSRHETGSGIPSAQSGIHRFAPRAFAVNRQNVLLWALRFFRIESYSYGGDLAASAIGTRVDTE